MSVLSIKKLHFFCFVLLIRKRFMRMSLSTLRELHSVFRDMHVWYISLCSCLTNSFLSEHPDISNPYLIGPMLHGLKLGLTSHPNNMAELFSLSDMQDPHPQWLRGKNPSGAPAEVQTIDLWSTAEPWTLTKITLIMPIGSKC